MMLRPVPSTIFFFNATATTEIYTLSLHDALPISARDLVQVEVGRHVHVSREEIVDDLALRQVLIHEADVVGHARALDLADKLISILLASLLQELGVRLSDDQVEGTGVARDDLGHRRDHVLETLARIDEAKGRQDRSVIHAQLPLQSVPATRHDRWHAVLDHDRALGYAVDVPEQPRRGLGHDHDPRSAS